MQLPIAGSSVIDQLAVSLRQKALGVGHDPFVTLRPTHGELAAMNLASLRSHVVGTADHDERQGHEKATPVTGEQRPPTDLPLWLIGPNGKNCSRGSPS